MASSQFNLHSNLTYSTTGLTASKCTIEAGGYARDGKQVIINIRLRTTDTLAANTIVELVKGFPPADAGSYAVVALAVSAYTDATAYLGGNGALNFMRAQGMGANNVINLSASYIAR